MIVVKDVPEVMPSLFIKCSRLLRPSIVLNTRGRDHQIVIRDTFV